MKQVKDLVAGQRQISASEFNRAMAEIERQSRITAEAPLEVLNTQNGINLRLADAGFWASITEAEPFSSSSGSSSCGCTGWLYGWVEMEPIEGAQFQEKAGGRSGSPTLDPAFELNGACVSVGTIVWLEPAYTGEWVFDQCCSVCSGSSSSGNGVTVVTAATCSSGSLETTSGTLTGSVTINGQQYFINFEVTV